ncbi:hypothetical protein GCM10027047_34780 [Rhodococcus aerolatus]
MTDAAPTLPPNWRTVVAPTGDRPGLYRSAAPPLGTPDELAATPRALTWLDLRTPGEHTRDRGTVPDGWTRASVDLHPRAQVDRADGTLLADIRDGRATFGDLYREILRDHPDQVAEAVRTLAATEGDVVVACMVGRDRTGVLVALVREVLGHDRSDTVADYLATTAEVPRFLSRIEGGPALTLDLTCHAADLEAALAVVDEAGGAAAWLRSHGVTDAELAALRDRWGRQGTR